MGGDGPFDHFIRVIARAAFYENQLSTAAKFGSPRKNILDIASFISGSHDDGYARALALALAGLDGRAGYQHMRQRPVTKWPYLNQISVSQTGHQRNRQRQQNFFAG